MSDPNEEIGKNKKIGHFYGPSANSDVPLVRQTHFLDRWNSRKFQWIDRMIRFLIRSRFLEDFDLRQVRCPWVPLNTQ